MSKPMIRIHNTELDEIIDREMTDSEYADFSKMKKGYEDYLDELKSNQDKKEAAEGKLAALGLTTDDLRALGL
jgi:formiminotetrahydrofolate cyclodeaminase